MKRNILVFIILSYSSIIFAQKELDIIYIDNHNTLNQFEIIESKLDSIIKDNEDNFMLFISSTVNVYSNADKPTIITNKGTYSSTIRETLLTPTSRPSLEMDIKYLQRKISELSNYKDNLRLGKGLSDGIKLNLHFFFDYDTFCEYQLDENFVNKLLLIYKLRNKDGINQNCNLTYYLYNNYDQDCSDDIEKNKKITIKKY